MALVAMPSSDPEAVDHGMHAVTHQGASLGRQDDAVHIVVNDEDVRLGGSAVWPAAVVAGPPTFPSFAPWLSRSAGSTRESSTCRVLARRRPLRFKTCKVETAPLSTAGACGRRCAQANRPGACAHGKGTPMRIGRWTDMTPAAPTCSTGGRRDGSVPSQARRHCASRPQGFLSRAHAWRQRLLHGMSRRMESVFWHGGSCGDVRG